MGMQASPHFKWSAARSNGCMSCGSASGAGVPRSRRAKCAQDVGTRTHRSTLISERARHRISVDCLKVSASCCSVRDLGSATGAERTFYNKGRSALPAPLPGSLLQPACSLLVCSNFPVSGTREFAGEWRYSALADARGTVERRVSRILPCIIPLNKDTTSRDGFAPDCVARQLVTVELEFSVARGHASILYSETSTS